MEKEMEICARTEVQYVQRAVGPGKGQGKLSHTTYSVDLSTF